MGWKSNRVMWDCNSPYAYRNENLRRLGFKSYRSYLKSALWATIRARVIDRDKRCVRCQWPKDLQVHHRAYDPATLRGDDINSLSTVCERCHKGAEKPDVRRPGYERLIDASAQVLKRKVKRKRWRRPRPVVHDFKPIWSR